MVWPSSKNVTGGNSYDSFLQGRHTATGNGQAHLPFVYLQRWEASFSSPLWKLEGKQACLHPRGYRRESYAVCGPLPRPGVQLSCTQSGDPSSEEGHVVAWSPFRRGELAWGALPRGKGSCEVKRAAWGAYRVCASTLSSRGLSLAGAGVAAGDQPAHAPAAL